MQKIKKITKQFTILLSMTVKIESNPVISVQNVTCQKHARKHCTLTYAQLPFAETL